MDQAKSAANGIISIGMKFQFNNQFEQIHEFWTFLPQAQQNKFSWTLFVWLSLEYAS